MARTIRYRQIADELRSRLLTEEFSPGDLLPSESELGSAHEVSRVTVRRALEQLRDEGFVDSRQGFGWFRATSPVAQNLSALSTLDAQLTASGRSSERQVLAFAYVDAPEEVAEVLGTTDVLEVKRCHLADGQPFARVIVWCPASLAHDLSRSDVETAPFVDLLKVNVSGARQHIGAVAASRDDAELLRVPAGSPLLRARRITLDSRGLPVLYAEHVFAAHVTEFVAELPYEPAAWAPAGLQLVE
ncbi:MAG: GntR family transcriptional regulator [Actinomycetia bacterium]|nr:GntR family transcriptional regulator [Actinomycetes bacterium]MCP4963449.1 GntR family transcriptional regulator [Actinomycetes bacterium]